MIFLAAFTQNFCYNFFFFLSFKVIEAVFAEVRTFEEFDPLLRVLVEDLSGLRVQHFQVFPLPQLLRERQLLPRHRPLMR